MPARAHLGLARSFQITHVLPRFTALENVALAVQARSGLELPLLAAGRARGGAQRPGPGGAGGRRPDRPRAYAWRAPCRMARSGASSWRSRSPRRPSSSCSTSRWRAPAPRRPSAWSPPSTRLKRRTTIVLVEHDMQAVFALADRISVLVEGRIIATGTPAGRARRPGRARRLSRRGGMSAPCSPSRAWRPATASRRCCSASISPSAQARW